LKKKQDHVYARKKKEGRFRVLAWASKKIKINK
jgi:hypothetical protein